MAFGITFPLFRIYGKEPQYTSRRSVSRKSKMRENVAETADLAPAGIDQEILAYFLLFNYSSLLKYSVTFQ